MSGAGGAIVLFDVDGTLVDSAPAITYSLRRAIEAVGLESPSDEVLGADIGPPLEDALASHGVPASAIPDARAAYRSSYSEVGSGLSRLYPGIREVLELLSSAGARLATATSKRATLAAQVCSHLGILEFFEVIGGAGELDRLHKPEILAWTLERLGGAGEKGAVMVGDKRFDVQGAHAHGLPCIGVGWGYGSQRELTEAGATVVVANPGELLGAIASVLAR